MFSLFPCVHTIVCRMQILYLHEDSDQNGEGSNPSDLTKMYQALNKGLRRW